MPPHIAQLILGHKDINTTMGYKAIYPEEAINGHRAFIARRRHCGPVKNTVLPAITNGKNSSATSSGAKSPWANAAGHTAPAASMSIQLCQMPPPEDRPRPAGPPDQDPRQPARPASPRPNAKAGPAKPRDCSVSLAGAEDKLAQTRRDREPAGPASINLGIPAFRDIAGRTATHPSQETTMTTGDLPARPAGLRRRTLPARSWRRPAHQQRHVPAPRRLRQPFHPARHQQRHPRWPPSTGKPRSPP